MAFIFISLSYFKRLVKSRASLFLHAFLLACGPCLAVLPVGGVWECRGTGGIGPGNDLNGGGIDAALVVTDYSQQNSAQLTLTDLATTGVVTTLTSATGGFTAAMVGNYIQISSGTNFTPSFYEITARASTNSVTLDRAPSTAAGSAGVGSVGGALATLGKLSGAMVASNKAFCTGAFTSTATNTFAQTVATPNPTTPATQLSGYGAVRNDGGRATVTLSGSTLTGISLTGSGFLLTDFIVDGASQTASTGINLGAGSYSSAYRCKALNCLSNGILVNTTNSAIIACEVTACTTAVGAIRISNSTGILVTDCFIHDNAAHGILCGNNAGSSISYNLIVNNSGTSDGISGAAIDVFITQNTIHNNGRDGIRFGAAPTQLANDVMGNLITNNGGVGLNSPTLNLPASSLYDGNAYYLNTSGARSNVDSTTGIYGVNPYSNTRDVILTASPYVGPTTGSTANFMLNDVPGGGQACRRAGSPGTWPGNTGTTGYLDLGAVQTRSNIRIPRGAAPPKAWKVVH